MEVPFTKRRVSCNKKSNKKTTLASYKTSKLALVNSDSSSHNIDEQQHNKNNTECTVGLGNSNRTIKVSDNNWRMSSMKSRTKHLSKILSTITSETNWFSLWNRRWTLTFKWTSWLRRREKRKKPNNWDGRTWKEDHFVSKMLSMTSYKKLIKSFS